MRLAMLVLMCGLASPSTAFEMKEARITSGHWSISAFADDETGDFRHCVATVPHRSGVSLAFSISKAGTSWRMGLTNSAWKLPSGTKYPITYAVDNRAPSFDEGYVATPQLIMWELPATDNAFQVFRTGYTLTVGAAGGDFTFNLTGSAKALELTLGCANYYRNRYVAGNQTSNPFETGVPASTTAEATTMLANVLGAAEIKGFKILSSVPAHLALFHAAYEAPGIIGGLRIQTRMSVPDAAAALIAADQKDCEGAYASTREKSENGVVSLWSACRLSTGGGMGILYVVTPREAGGVYVLAAVQIIDSDTEGPSGVIEEAGDGIFDASIRGAR